jgi:hypothetical protein
MLYNPIDTNAKVFTHAVANPTLELELLPNWIADCALLYRIMAVYPRSSTPFWKWTLILAPPIVFKAVRVACWIGFNYTFTHPGGEVAHFKWIFEERIWTVIER